MTSDYLHAADCLRMNFTRPAIMADVIVGFPGESDTEFGQTMDFVRRVGFARLHVFKYSARKGTAAASMPGQLTQAVKHTRSEQLIALGKQTQAAYLAAGIGGTAHVLFEEPCIIDGKKYMRGYSERYERVLTRTDTDTSGILVPIRLQGINAAGDVLGEPLTTNP
jgi:threonylcarbamoyladenosine tRNA methylthiotransferase MtaB